MCGWCRGLSRVLKGDSQHSSGVVFQSASALAGLAKAQWLGCVTVSTGIPGL